MGYKKEENIQSLDRLQVPKTLEKFIAELPERYANGSINKEIEVQIDKEWIAFRNGMKKNNRVFGKKVVDYPSQQLFVFSYIWHKSLLRFPI